VEAPEADAGTPFRLNRQYAECFADGQVVLSATYGLVAPEFLIPGPCEVSFKVPATRSISGERSRDQVREQDLDHYSVVVDLLGRNYRAPVEAAFAKLPVRLVFPFACLPLEIGSRATGC